MGYLRVLNPPAKEPSPKDACVAAFDQHLTYVFETLRRLGARPAEIEDLAHDVFLVLHRNWPTLDTSRPLRPYLFGVAFRIVCAHKRRRSREVFAPSLEAIDGAMGQEQALLKREAVALLLSIYEATFPGWRRALGILFTCLSATLILLSNSKTAFGLALVCPLIAQAALVARRTTRASLAVVILTIPVAYYVLSSISNINMNRLAYILYHDSTLTGRTIIWDFVQNEIARRPLIGWGYQSFWFVPNSPAISDAPGWVKMMPNAHNGYYDTLLELGYVGLALLLTFIFTTLHAVGRVADRDPARARLLLSLILFAICYNYFESLWMRGFEFLWVVFLIAAAEVGRQWNALPAKRPVSSANKLTVDGFRATRHAPYRMLRSRLT